MSSARRVVRKSIVYIGLADPRALGAMLRHAASRTFSRHPRRRPGVSASRNLLSRRTKIRRSLQSPRRRHIRSTLRPRRTRPHATPQRLDEIDESLGLRRRLPARPRLRRRSQRNAMPPRRPGRQALVLPNRPRHRKTNQRPLRRTKIPP